MRKTTGTVRAARNRDRFSTGHALPHWNAEANDLDCFGRIVKLRFDAANLRAVLDAFEAQGWPQRIANPLHADNGVPGKRKLQQAAKSLNHRLRGTGLRLRMDGVAMGVCWELYT